MCSRNLAASIDVEFLLDSFTSLLNLPEQKCNVGKRQMYDWLKPLQYQLKCITVLWKINNAN